MVPEHGVARIAKDWAVCCQRVSNFFDERKVSNRELTTYCSELDVTMVRFLGVQGLGVLGTSCASFFDLTSRHGDAEGIWGSRLWLGNQGPGSGVPLRARRSLYVLCLISSAVCDSQRSDVKITVHTTTRRCAAADWMRPSKQISPELQSAQRAMPPGFEKSGAELYCRATVA